MKPKLTEEVYVKHLGMCCPFCESSDIKADEPIQLCYADLTFQDCSCITCGGIWADRYRLEGYDIKE